MIEDLVHTDADPIWVLARVVAGAVIFPYGIALIAGFLGRVAAGGLFIIFPARSSFTRRMAGP
jgi:hypothetical protein